MAIDRFEDNLSRSSEITIHVTGRKSGHTISLPIWFVWDDGTLYLLPVKGSDTQWYKNVLQKPTMQFEAGSAKKELKVDAVTDPTRVKLVVEKFRRKYGSGDVQKYYSSFDAAVFVQTR